MNPPYGRAIPAWTGHLCREYAAGRVTQAIALLPARTDTAWFRGIAPFTICFLHGRLRFSGTDTGAPFPSMAVYLGPNPKRFADAFADAGGDLAGSRKRFHHRATSGFFHNGRMNVYFADGHGSAVKGKTVDPLPVSDWPGGALMDKTTAFYPTLTLPTADENPNFWGPPYDKW